MFNRPFVSIRKASHSSNRKILNHAMRILRHPRGPFLNDIEGHVPRHLEPLLVLDVARPAPDPDPAML